MMAIVVAPISPIAFSVLGLPVRWYALAYIAAFVIGYYLFGYLMKRKDSQIKLSKKQMDDLMSFVILGVIIGGRLGYVCIYNLSFFLLHPWEIFAVWHGGMSFHGGLLGVVIAMLLFARRLHRTDKEFMHVSTYNVCFKILDIMAVVAPLGFFFGRIANFINREVMGRPTDSPLGVVFVGDTPIPRHPSPLYEAVTEGVLLFVILFCLYRFTKLRRYPGAIAGTLGMLYAIFRVFCEQFRAPDAQIGFLTSWGLTMGQLLSGILFVVGATVFAYSFRQNLKNK